MVDYGIICRNLLDKFNYFKVHPLTTFSNHCMISTDIDVKIRPVSKHIKNELHNFPVKFVWNNESKDKFLAAIQDNLTKNSVNINSNDCIDILTSKLVTYLQVLLMSHYYAFKGRNRPNGKKENRGSVMTMIK